MLNLDSWGTTHKVEGTIKRGRGDESFDFMELGFEPELLCKLDIAVIRHHE